MQSLYHLNIVIFVWWLENSLCSIRQLSEKNSAYHASSKIRERNKITTLASVKNHVLLVPSSVFHMDKCIAVQY